MNEPKETVMPVEITVDLSDPAIKEWCEKHAQGPGYVLVDPYDENREGDRPITRPMLEGLRAAFYFDAVEWDASAVQTDEADEDSWFEPYEAGRESPSEYLHRMQLRLMEHEARELSQKVVPMIAPVLAQMLHPKPRPCSECRHEATCERISYCAAFKCGFGEASQP